LGSDDNFKVTSTPVSHFEATLWVVATESEIFLKTIIRKLGSDDNFRSKLSKMTERGMQP